VKGQLFFLAQFSCQLFELSRGIAASRVYISAATINWQIRQYPATLHIISSLPDSDSNTSCDMPENPMFCLFHTDGALCVTNP
jgi:hypothetical protein